MLYTITAVSPEVEDFVIELQIESTATFADLHQLIRRTCAWGPHKPSTFYVCDDHWHRDRTIPEQSYEYDTMDEVELGDYLDDEGQRLQYIFDAEEGRGLLIEVSHINYGRHIEQPTCRRSHGTPPALILEKQPAHETKSTQDLLAELNAAALAEEDDIEPNDEDLFDMGEIDLEGFDFTEGE